MDPCRAQRLLRHGDVPRRLQLPGDRKHAVLRKQWQRKQKSGHELRRDIAGQGIAARLQLPAHAQKIILPPQLHPVRLQQLPQRAKRTLRQPAVHPDLRADAQRPEDRQQKPQRRAALSRVQRSLRRVDRGRLDPKPVCLRFDLRPQRPQALHRRLDILAEAVQHKVPRRPGQRGADEHPVRLRF